MHAEVKPLEDNQASDNQVEDTATDDKKDVTEVTTPGSNLF